MDSSCCQVWDLWKTPHVLKHALMWRCTAWWEWQQFYNEAGAPWSKLVHSQTVGKLRRWEWHLLKNWVIRFGGPAEPSGES